MSSFVRIISKGSNQRSVLNRQAVMLWRQKVSFFSSKVTSTTDETTAKGRVIENTIKSSTAADAEAAEKIADISIAKPQSPKPIFPWRHETMDNPLPRLTPGTPEFNTDMILPTRAQSWLAYFFLDVPAWEVILSNHWRTELAEPAAWAFAQGVAGIVSNVYELPLRSVVSDNDENDDESAKVNFVYPPKEEDDSSSTTTATENNKESDNSTQKEGAKTVIRPEGAKSAASLVEEEKTAASIADEAGTENKSKEDEHSKEENNDVNSMLSRPLRNLFQSAHDYGKDQLVIQLETQPINAMLYSVFCIPYVSREAVEKDPTLLTRMKETMGTIRQNPIQSSTGIFDFVGEELEHNNKLETTVEIQVLVECKERFQVLDSKTGVTLQGDGEEKNVMHVVRLESKVISVPQDNFPYAAKASHGNWQITDIDDLVSPKAWYQK